MGVQIGRPLVRRRGVGIIEGVCLAYFVLVVVIYVFLYVCKRK